MRNSASARCALPTIPDSRVQGSLPPRWSAAWTLRTGAIRCGAALRRVCPAGSRGRALCAGFALNRVFAVNDQYLADVLHGLCSRSGANVCQKRFALAAIGSENPQFDELMAFQRPVSLCGNGRTQSLVADHDHGVECVGARLEFALLQGCENFHDEILVR